MADELKDQHEQDEAFLDKLYEPKVETPPAEVETTAQINPKEEKKKPAKKKAVATTPAAPVETPEPEVEEKPTHPSWLSKEAAALGMDEDEISSYSTDLLSRTVSRLQRMERDAVIRSHQQPRPEPKPEPKPEVVSDEDESDLNEDEYDPKMVKKFRKLDKYAKEQAAEMKAIKEELQYHRQQAERSQLEESRRVFDGHIADLGPKYEKHLGKGPGSKLKQDSTAWNGRRELATHVFSLAKTFQELGRTVDHGELVQMAAKVLWPDVKDVVEEEDVEETDAKEQAKLEKVKRWNAGALATPNGRSAEEPRGTARAVKAVKAVREAHGVSLEDKKMLEMFPE